jgi:hypothetical protein
VRVHILLTSKAYTYSMNVFNWRSNRSKWSPNDTHHFSKGDNDLRSYTPGCNRVRMHC